MVSVKFAPVNIPLSRRLQTLSVICVSLLGFFGPVTGTLSFILLLLTPLSIVAIIYGAIYFLFDVDKPSRGGRRFNIMRRLPHWKYFCDYFPIKLIKTNELDPNHNYIFGYHPHGVISSGCFGSFGTEGAGFSELFPGIVPHILTLEINFRFPFHRDFLMSLGICDVSKESIQYICTQKGKGNAAIIVIGGASESLEAYPGNATLRLKERKGFAKMALKTGAHLVPVFGFGENDLMNQAQHPLLRYFQEKFRKFSGVAPVLFYGRGIFQYNFGLLPHRVPLYIVVGAAIEVKQSDNPTQEMINELHQKYIDALRNIYDVYKEKYARNPNVELKIV